MYRKAEDFLADWDMNAKGTLHVMQAITEEKKNVSIVEGHNSLEWLAWHLVSVAGAFGHFAGLQIPAPGPDMPIPQSIKEIVEMYEAVTQAYKKEAEKLTDEQMIEEVESFVGQIERGNLLRKLIDHQTHHRGQMTVLLRQAGLKVPPVMGPTVEMQN